MFPRPFTLIDAHTCPYHERQYGHLVFRDADRTLSVFVDPSAGAPLPAGDDRLQMATPALTVEEARYHGYEAAAVATRAHQIVVVSDLPRAAHVDLVRLLVPDLVAFTGSLER